MDKSSFTTLSTPSFSPSVTKPIYWFYAANERLTLSMKCLLICIGSSFFGICLTSYIIFIPDHPYEAQVLSSAIKIPVIILVGTVVASLAVILANRMFRPSRPTSLIASGAMDCLSANAAALAALGPVMALIGAAGNYSVTIFSAYAAFALAGAVGCGAFFLRIGLGRDADPPTVALALIWCLFFGVIGAQTGWSMRPIVGWTGQKFAWFRTSHATLWDQMRCEGHNLERGGVRFPRAKEQSDTKSWPC
jgi:hypothetical protein